MDTTIQAKAEKWLNSNIDDSAKQEIQDMMQSNPEQLSDAFYKDLEFGTGGLRGIMGAGSNRVNKYTVGMATQGLANYLKKNFSNKEIKVAIAYDSRNNSQYFAEITANVFSANGIKVYFFSELRPTPELSFAIRHLGCDSGVVITASHNPKEYNGYKAYWNDGGQLTAPHDKNVIEEVSKINSIDDVKFAKVADNIINIDKEVDEAYLERLVSLSVAKDAIVRQKDLKIVYTPIHGAGVTMVPQVLDRFGFANVTVLESQATPDGNFPTVVYPNPEEAEALSLALKKCEEIDADLLLATDPDTDRVGIAVKNHHGEFQLLNGNQTGSVLIYYLIKKWEENKKLNGNQYVVKTIVTTDIIEKIAAHYNVEFFNTLTGFKYIAELLKENEGKKEFIAGGEESYGYLAGDFVRDKDAVVSSALIAEMVAYAKDQGKSLFDFLMDMYLQFGFYKERLLSITKKGQSGEAEIKQMMVNLRENPPVSVGGSKLTKIVDYQKGEEKDLVNVADRAIDFPISNVLQFFTEDGTKVSARPSGTEPKIKFYFSVNEPLPSRDAFDAVNDNLESKIDAIIDELRLK